MPISAVSEAHRKRGGRRAEAWSFDKGEAGEWDIPRGGAVLKEEVRDLGRAIVGVDDVPLELHPQGGPLADGNPFEGMLAGDFQVDRQRFGELDGVVHGSSLAGPRSGGSWWRVKTVVVF